MSNLKKIAEFILKINYDDVPKEVKEKVKTILLHNISVGMAGKSGAILAQKYLESSVNSGSNESTILYNGLSTSAVEAAFVNGIMFHSRVQDDVLPSCGTHVGSIAIPTALAVAEAKGSSGKRFLEAVLAAYEVTSCLGNGFKKLSTQKGFRSSGIYGPFGAAAAASKLYELNEEQTVNALALAANFASGLNQTWIAGTGEYQVHTAMAAKHGVIAAKLALAGLSGASDTLEGTSGFYKAYTGEQQDLSENLGKLGVQWDILNVTFKPYPVCAINQAPVDTMMKIIKENDIDLKNINQVKVNLNQYEATYPGIDNVGPFNNYSATLMSTQFCMATVIKHKTVSIELLESFDDKDILNLMNKIEIIPDESIHPYGCAVSVVLNSGKEIKIVNNLGGKTMNYGWDKALSYVTNLKSEQMINENQFNNFVAEIIDIEKSENINKLINNLSATTALLYG